MLHLYMCFIKEIIRHIFGVYSGSTNYTVGSPFAYAPMGVATYIPNMVKENNLNECYLVIQPANTAPATLYGYWSPDSI